MTNPFPSGGGPGPALTAPVQLYTLDPETEAAADTWPIVISCNTEEGTEANAHGQPLYAIRCNHGAPGQSCRAHLGIAAGYTFHAPDLRPLILAHITRSHGYPANPERIEP